VAVTSPPVARPTQERLQAATTETTAIPAVPPLAIARAEKASTPSAATGLVAVEPGDHVRPLNEDFDYFPLDALNVGSELGREIFNEFLQRRWGSVSEKGVLNRSLDYLKLNPI